MREILLIVLPSIGREIGTTTTNEIIRFGGVTVSTTSIRIPPLKMNGKYKSKHNQGGPRLVCMVPRKRRTRLSRGACIVGRRPKKRDMLQPRR